MSTSMSIEENGRPSEGQQGRGGSGAGVLDERLAIACHAALEIGREQPRAHALRHGWAAASERFASLLAPRGLTHPA